MKIVDVFIEEVKKNKTKIEHLEDDIKNNVNLTMLKKIHGNLIK